MKKKDAEERRNILSLDIMLQVKGQESPNFAQRTMNLCYCGP